MQQGCSRTFDYSPSVTINYQVAGDGPVSVVMLHGYVASLVTWHDLREFFPSDEFTLYLIDLKGHGHSSKPRDNGYSLAVQAAIVRSFISERKLGNIVLAGHSMGGAVALLVALGYAKSAGPSPLSRLILLDTPAYIQKMPKFIRILQKPLLGTILLHLVPPKVCIRQVLNTIFHNKAAITGERIERYTEGFDDRNAAYAFITTIRQFIPNDYHEVVDGYRAISIPTLVIWGENDRLVPPETGKRLCRELPYARLVLIPESGHNPHEERPEETWEAISGFLS